MLPIILSAVESPGDQDFLCQLYTKYQRLMFSTAKKYLVDPQEVEDAVQDALVKMIEIAAKLRDMDRCALPALVVIIVRNTSIDHAKHLNVMNKHTTPLSDRDDATGEAPSLDELAILAERSASLRSVWPRLSDDEQLLLYGKYAAGLSDQELARLIGCKPNSIRMKLTRARRKALNEMKKERCFYDEP